MLQQMAHFLLLLILLLSFLLLLGHLWRRTHTPPSPKSRMQVIYHERSRSPQIKVCCASAWFSLCSRGFGTSLTSMSLSDTEWVWKSQWHRWEFVFASILFLRSILNIFTDQTNLQFHFFSFSGKLKGLVFCRNSQWKWNSSLNLFFILSCYFFSIPLLIYLCVYLLCEESALLNRTKCDLSERRSVQNPVGGDGVKMRTF